MTDLRIGVVGCGRISQAAHLPALSRADGATLVSVCDPSEVLAGGVGQRYDVPHETDLEKLLANADVDAVILAVPDRLHLPLAIQVLDAGKHLLVEKPITGTLSDAEKLAAAATASGLVLQVGAMKRHDPGVQYAAEAVQRIGRLLSVSSWYRVMSGLRPGTEKTLFPAMVVDQQVKDSEATFKADRETYLLITHGAHVFDGLRYLVGEVADVTARHVCSGADHTWHAIMGLASGALSDVEITANVHSEWSEGMDIYGELGSVHVRSYFPFALRASDVSVFDETSAVTTRPCFDDTNPYERQIESFVRAVRDGAPVHSSAQDGVEAVRLIEAVAASARDDGRRVTL